MAEISIIEDEIISGRPANWPSPGEMCFRLADDVLGTLDLSCDTGYVVRSYEFGSPEMREVTYPNALDDGNLDFTAFIGPRAVTLDMVLRNTANVNGTGLTRSEPRMRDNLLKFVHPWRRPRLYFSEHGDTYIDDNGLEQSRIRFFTLRGSDAPISVSRPQFNELSASWVAPTGIIENVNLHRATFTFGPDLAAEYHIHTNNLGTVPAYWNLAIEGKLDSPFLELPEYTPSPKLWLNYHLEEPTNVFVDSQNKTVSIQRKDATTGKLGPRTAVGFRYLDDRSDWFRIPPGPQTIVISHTGITTTGAAPYGYWAVDPDATAHGGPARWSTSRAINVSANPAYLVNPAQYATLTILKNNPIQGDGHYTGKMFGPGEHVVLGNASQAWYDSGLWVAGYRPVSTAQWVWALPTDPTTGEPSIGRVTFTYREAYL